MTCYHLNAYAPYAALSRRFYTAVMACSRTAVLTVSCWVIVGFSVAGCASLPTHVDRPVSVALTDFAGTRLGQAVAARAASAATRNDSGFALVGTAELALSSRMALIQAAQKTLDLQYYAIHADDTTERLLHALREAAARGVRIRILLDDFNTTGKNAQVLQLAFEKNIQMRLFNPLPGGRSSMFFRVLGNLDDVSGMQRRMHNKIFVADNAVAIAGGRNLGDTYFGQNPATNFVDMDVLTVGRITRDLSRSFDLYWNNPLAFPVQSLLTAKSLDDLKQRVSAPTASADAIPEIEASPPAKPASISVAAPSAETTPWALPALTWAPAVMLVDKPDKIAADADAVEQSQDTAVDGLLQLMTSAQNDVLLVSPYFVPGSRMMGQMANLRKRGVRVRVLTNSLASNDAPAAHAGYARYRHALLAIGVELFEMRGEARASLKNSDKASGRFLGSGGTGTTSGSAGGTSRSSLHAKLAVIDKRLLVVGSMNLDLRSQLQNSEVAVVIRSTKLAAEAIGMVEPALSAGSWQVVLDDGDAVWRAPLASGLTDSRTEPDTSLGLRLMMQLIGPFAPEEML